MPDADLSRNWWTAGNVIETGQEPIIACWPRHDKTTWPAYAPEKPAQPPTGHIEDPRARKIKPYISSSLDHYRKLLDFPCIHRDRSSASTPFAPGTMATNPLIGSDSFPVSKHRVGHERKTPILDIIPDAAYVRLAEKRQKKKIRSKKTSTKTRLD